MTLQESQECEHWMTPRQRSSSAVRVLVVLLVRAALVYQLHTLLIVHLRVSCTRLDRSDCKMKELREEQQQQEKVTHGK